MTGMQDDDGNEGGLAKAADSFAENLGDHMPDGVDNGPTDDADEPADGRTRTHASISEGLNANDDEPPADTRDGSGATTDT